MALHALKHSHSRLTVFCLSGNKKRECCLISMSLAVAGTKTEREKSVIDKSGDTLNIDYRFLHGFAKLRKLKKNIKNKIFWLILAGAIVTRVLNAYLKL